MATDLDIAAAATELVYSPQVVGNSSALMQGYVVDRIFDDQWDTTGFYAVGFLNVDAGVAIVAIRGSEDRLDIVSNGNLGVDQYLLNRVPLIEYIGSNILARRIIVAGHSLGGGLAQYLVYDAAREYPGFRKKLTVHTHNGFGGVAGITQLYERFDRKVLDGVTVRNFRHPEDMVSRIGRHTGAVYNIQVPAKAPGGFVYAHANKRFLPPESPFAAARKVREESFALRETISELGPELQQALRAIIRNGEPIAGFALLSKLVTAVPRRERRSLLSALATMLPFRQFWQRWLAPRPHRPRAAPTKLEP